MHAKVRLHAILAGVFLACGIASLASEATERQRTTALREFGEEKYDQALPALKELLSRDTANASIYLFYVGECHYRMQSFAAARGWFVLAIETPFNQEESYWRLAQIAETDGDMDNVRKYHEWIVQRKDSLAKGRPVLNKERIEQLRKQKKAVLLMSNFGPKGWTTGGGFMQVKWYKEAIWNYEYGLTHGVPLSARFSSPEVALMYEALAKAYNAQAVELRKRGGQPEKVAEAEQLARHNEWRLFITETRIGTNWVERILGYGH